MDGVGLLLEETSWCLPAHDAHPGARVPEPVEGGGRLTWMVRPL